ncbi:tryptophan--tRNA ligase [Patescibacteria group bacterium]|nr:tryptophan--tRNA ligase [Patescibacteria group bacterium]MBU4116016.1 tryptophan--tRNA ligase [Patescibacteria group bacterium]
MDKENKSLDKLETRKILLSGVKPSGHPHIGNYFGAMKQFVALQDDYESYIFIADLHALTIVQNKEQMNNYIYNIAVDYLAIGLNPEKVVLYKQSDIPQVSEMAWIFNCITTMPFLMRAHAFKDAEAKNKEINVGVFGYPILMAADILLPGADVVPVGNDQKQHVEFARDIAQKFNNIFGKTFKLPEPMIFENIGTIIGTDGQKMSKSYQNTIELFATDEELNKAIMGIVTDSKDVKDKKEPEKCNIFNLHKLFSPDEELKDLRDRYVNGKIGYKESKEVLLKNVVDFIKPIREEREKIQKNREYILDVLENGGKKAEKKISEKMEEVRTKIGLSLK